MATRVSALCYWSSPTDGKGSARQPAHSDWGCKCSDVRSGLRHLSIRNKFQYWNSAISHNSSSSINSTKTQLFPHYLTTVYVRETDFWNQGMTIWYSTKQSNKNSAVPSKRKKVNASHYVEVKRLFHEGNLANAGSITTTIFNWLLMGKFNGWKTKSQPAQVVSIPPTAKGLGPRSAWMPMLVRPLMTELK